MAAKRPTERNLELGRALRDARIRAGFGRQADVAERLGCSQPTIVRVERGEKHPTEGELATLLDLYKPDNRAEIEDLARLVTTGGLALHPHFEELLRLEERAVAIRTFTTERIPMPLQCERYVLKQYNEPAGSQPMKDALRLHARRIDLLERKKGPSFDALMSFSSLLRMPGGQADLVKDQAQHLLTLAESAPRLTMRVLMFDANIPYVDSDFTLVTERGSTPSVVYVPFGRDGRKITDKDKIEERTTYWDLALEAALTPEQTADLLRELAEGAHQTIGRSGFSVAT